MGYDTKPNLDYSKFEQRTGDTLNLSGVTKVYNRLAVESGATFIMKSNAGDGKVLTSDAVGNISLQPSSNIVHGLNIYTTLSNPVNLTTASRNVFLGYESGNAIRTGCDNIALGSYSLSSNCSGNTNVAIGTNSLLTFTCGCGNVAVGNFSMLLSESGRDNTAIGSSAMGGLVCGCNNAAIGKQSLNSNCGGINNIAFGNCTLYNNTIGNNNSGFGTCSLFFNTSGCDNVALGYQSLFNNVSGCKNVAIGYDAGYNETGSSKLHIANNANKSLIYGEFDTEKLCIRGKTYISGLTNASKTNVIYYDTSTKELSYGIAPSGTGSTSYNFTNGLTESGGNVCLGGVLSYSCFSSISGNSYLGMCLDDYSSTYLCYFNCDTINAYHIETGLNSSGINLLTYDDGNARCGALFICPNRVGSNVSDNIQFVSCANIYCDYIELSTYDMVNNTYGYVGTNCCYAFIESYNITASTNSTITSSPTELTSYVFDNSKYSATCLFPDRINLTVCDSSGLTTINMCGSNNSEIVVNSSAPDFVGVVYNDDYSANYTDRSLVDKGYVNSLLTGGTSYNFFNGLTESGGNVCLGGTLTGNTIIDISNKCFYICSPADCVKYSAGCGFSILMNDSCQNGGWFNLCSKRYGSSYSEIASTGDFLGLYSNTNSTFTSIVLSDCDTYMGGITLDSHYNSFISCVCSTQYDIRYNNLSYCSRFPVHKIYGAVCISGLTSAQTTNVIYYDNSTKELKQSKLTAGIDGALQFNDNGTLGATRLIYDNSVSGFTWGTGYTPTNGNIITILKTCDYHDGTPTGFISMGVDSVGQDMFNLCYVSNYPTGVGCSVISSTVPLYLNGGYEGYLQVGDGNYRLEAYSGCICSNVVDISGVSYVKVNNACYCDYSMFTSNYRESYCQSNTVSLGQISQYNTCNEKYVLTKTTSNATATLLAFGIANNQYICLCETTSNSHHVAMSFDACITGVDAISGATVSFFFEGAIKRPSGNTVSFVGTPAKVCYKDTILSAVDANVYANNTNKRLDFCVCGLASGNMMWHSVVNTSEIVAIKI